MNEIPFLDLAANYKELQEEIEMAILRVARRGSYVLGDEVEQFEQAWASYCGVSYTVGVGNGLDALELALRAVGVGPGDEVVVPSHTFIATWLAVRRIGAVAVPVDVSPVTFNIDVGALESALSSSTKAVVPVHLYGRPAQMDKIMELSDRFGFMVVEDAAQAHGAFFSGRRVGGWGHAAAWSFYPGKNLGALGDGGAVTTNDPEVAERVRLLRNYGSKKKYYTEVAGFNSRLDTIQAAALLVKLKHLDEWNGRRSEYARRYRELLDGIKAVTLPEAPRDEREHVWHLFVIRLGERERIANELRKLGVGTIVHYPVPPHRQVAMKEFQHFQFPVTDVVADTVLSLPMGPHLSEESVKYVSESLIRVLE